MSLDIGSAIRNGAERTVKRNGLIIAGLLFAVSVLSSVFSSSLIQAMLDEGMIPSQYATETIPLALGLSTVSSGVLLFATMIVSTVVGIGVLRTFVSDETERVPLENFTRNVVMALLNLLVGGIAYAIILVVGFMAFIIPGFFLLVSLYFWNVFVIVEDQNFVEAFKSSWNLTQGNRLELFGLGVIVVFAALIFGGVFGLLGGLLEIALGSAAATIFEQLPNAFISAFSVATLAQAYNQLRE